MPCKGQLSIVFCQSSTGTNSYDFTIHGWPPWESWLTTEEERVVSKVVTSMSLLIFLLKLFLHGECLCDCEYGLVELVWGSD